VLQAVAEKAIISPAAGLSAKSIRPGPISPAMFTYENPYLAELISNLPHPNPSFPFGVPLRSSVVPAIN